MHDQCIAIVLFLLALHIVSATISWKMIQRSTIVINQLITALSEKKEND